MVGTLQAALGVQGEGGEKSATAARLPASLYTAFGLLRATWGKAGGISWWWQGLEPCCCYTAACVTLFCFELAGQCGQQGEARAAETWSS